MRCISILAAATALTALTAACAVEGEGDDVAIRGASALGAPDAPNTLFPGNPACSGGGCESALAGPDLFIPARNGKPWTDTYTLGNSSAHSVGGYSSGRIALLRRLVYMPEGQRWAVMLDPSYYDGKRAFAGTAAYGHDIVKEWLAADPSRKFMLVYSTTSGGWQDYAQLRRDAQVGSQVKICSLDAVAHTRVPDAVGADAITDPEHWDNGSCITGTGTTTATGDDSGEAEPTAATGSSADGHDCQSGTLDGWVSHGTCVWKNDTWYVCDRTQPAAWPRAGAGGAPECSVCPQRPDGRCD